MPDTLTSKRRNRTNKTERRNTKSMGDLKNPPDVNHKKKDISPDINILRIPSHKRHERKLLGSKSVAQESLAPSHNSPFQKAVIANGILDPPVSTARGRRMSREEIVTAAVLSQLELKSRRVNKRHQRKSSNVEVNTAFTKSKSATSLAAQDRYDDWQNTRKRSTGTEQVVLPRIMQSYASSPHEDRIEVTSMRKNMSMDTLNRKRGKSWGTIELDASYSTYTTNSIASIDSMPVQTMQMYSYGGSRSTFDQSVPSHASSEYLRHQNRGIALGTPLHSTGGFNVLHDPYAPQASDLVSLRAIPPNSEINRLLSAGINADSNVLRKYDLLHPNAKEVLAAPALHGGNRRHSVNMAVQTEESRVS